MTDFLDSIGDEDGTETEFDQLSAIAGDSFSLSDMKDRECIWRIMIWSLPGMGKSHFAYTMPKPVCFIDTEGKADIIAHKFDMEDEDFRMWQPKSYAEAKTALDQSIAYLTHFKETEGRIGTIVVDSMSIMWELAQQHHADQFYGGNKPAEGFKSAIGSSGTGDWVHIKRYHNAEFRQVMLDSPFHLLWTAMEDEDYSKKMQEGLQVVPMKPAGEKNNAYKVTDVIRLEEDGEGRPVAMCQKSGLLKHRYAGLAYPTFDKHKDLTETIEKMEIDGTEVPDSMEYDGNTVYITEGVPRFMNEDG